MAEAVIDKARALLATGKKPEAYRDLCEAASEPGLQLEARAALKEMFPVPKEAQDWIRDTLPALFAENADARRKAAKVLMKVALGEYHYKQRDRIGHPQAMDYIKKALASNDPKVAEAAIIATTRVTQFYYRDSDAYQAVLKLLRSPKVNTRRWAVEAATYLGRDRAAEAILPLLSDKFAEVQTEVGRMIMSLAQSKRLSQPAKSKAIDLMLGRFASYASGVRNVILNAMREINDPAVIEALRSAAETEPEEPLRKKIADIIRNLETHGQTVN
jgi:HEAT repeat protein